MSRHSKKKADFSITMLAKFIGLNLLQGDSFAGLFSSARRRASCVSGGHSVKHKRYFDGLKQ